MNKRYSIYTHVSSYFMKTYISDIIPKIQRFSQKLDDLTILTNQHWVSIGEIGQTKLVYIFRAEDKLIISDNGIVKKGTWEYLGNQYLHMDTGEGSFLLKHDFIDQNVLALKLDSTNKYAFFVNETKYDKELNSIEDVFRFLTIKYLTNKDDSSDKGSYYFKITEKDQKEWMQNPDKCPGCGFSGVLNKNQCPDCGLNLT